MSSSCLSKNTQYYWYSIVCYISGGSNLLVIALCLIPRVMESNTKKIIISIAINNLLGNLFFILSINSTGYFCVFVSYFKTSLLPMGVIWAALISKILDDFLIQRKQPKPYLFKVSSLICYVIIPILFILPFSTNSYAITDYDCSGFKNDVFGIMWRFILMYLPCFLIMMMVFVYYFRIYRFLKTSDSFTTISFLLNRGLIYSILFIVIFFLLSIARIIELFHPTCTSSILVFIGVVLIFLQGLFSLFITLSRQDIRQFLQAFLTNRERVESDDYIDQIINPININ